MDLLAECQFDTAYLLIFSDNVFASLIYYSHLGPSVVSLLLGIFVLINNPRGLANRILFLITFLFSVWAYFDLILWATERPEYSMFFWSALIHVELLIYILSLYLVLYFANGKKEISLYLKVIGLLLSTPVLLLAHTSFNLLGFDFTNCDRAAIEGPLWQYVYFVEFIIIGWVIIAAIRGWHTIKETAARAELALISIGVAAFLAIFAAGNITLILSLEWQYEQYKLFGMPILVAFIAYSIVKFKSLNGKLILAQILVVGLAVATLSLLFVRTIENVRVIAGLTFALVCVVGFILVRNVQREIRQREHIEQLAKDLESANERQVSLIHFITHQIKGFVTKSRNIFAAIKEGDCGVVPEAAKPMIEEGFSSDTKGLVMIQDILNAANIKSGKVTFKMEPFDLKSLIEEIIASLKSAADAKGLALNVSLGNTLTITGDRAQLSNVFKNVIDNAIKYTPKGSVSVTLEKKDGKVVFTEQDTGVGITKEDMAKLFTEGGHGVESKKVNVESTGFGLYIAKSIVEAHKGRIWAESEGEGKGSKFIIELPL
jgi:signal transduction histidine kinase